MLVVCDMDTGIYNTAFRMVSSFDRLQASSENLANASTPGYRKLISVQGKFDHLLEDAALRPDIHNPNTVAIDMTPGAMKSTGAPLDMAVSGEGFFVVARNGQEYYTRNGSFMRTPDGDVVTRDGFALMGDRGPVRIPEDVNNADLTVDSDRNLSAGGEVIAELRLVNIDRPEAIRRVGSTMFAGTRDYTPPEMENGTVVNRMLEGSNSSAIEEITELISCSRAFEACQRMIRSQDQALGKDINQHLQ